MENVNEIYENGIDIDGLDDDIAAANTSVDDIESENINLMMIAIDRSGSMGKYRDEMKNALEDFKESLSNSKEADEILVARANFDDYVYTDAGYKNITEFDTSYETFCTTRMYDCIVEATKKMLDYRKYLMDNGVRVKCVFAMFSDGNENGSNATLQEAKRAIEDLNQKEITTAFISFGSDAKSEATNLGFRNILDLNVNASELRKAFNCLSKSVIESSKSVIADGDDFFV